MKITKKLLLGFGTIASVAAPIAAVVSCGNGIPAESWEGSRRDVRIMNAVANGINSDLAKPVKFATPGGIGVQSWSDANITGGAELNSAAAMLLKPFSIGTIRSNDLAPGSKDITWNDTRKTGYLLEYAESITFTLKDGSTEVFDKDVKSFDGGNTQFDTSDRSVNGQHFKDVLATDGITDVKFKIRKGGYWVQNKSFAKGDEIVAEDFFDGIMNVATGAKQIGNAIGVENYAAIKAQFKAKYNSELWEYDATATNSSYIKTGFNWARPGGNNWFSEANKENVIKDDSINFKFEEQTGIKLTQLFNFIFKSAVDGAALPHKVLDEAATKLIAGVPAITPEIRKNPVTKYGVFYANSTPWDQQYFAGQYAVSENSKKILSFKQNPYYVRKDWLADKTRIRSFTHEFYDVQGDPKSVEYAGYKQGYYATLAMGSGSDSLTSDQFTNLLNNLGSTGGQFSKAQSSTKGTSRPYQGSDMNPTKKTSDLYYYNDNYSKLLYGLTRDKLINETPEEAAKSQEWSLNGIGASFRSALNAILNRDTMSEYIAGSGQAWNRYGAPEQKIPGTTENLIDSQDVYTNFSYKVKEDTTSKAGFIIDPTTKVGVTHQDYIDVLEGNAYKIATWKTNTPNDMDKLGPGSDLYKKLQAIIKDDLDKAGIKSTQKVTFEKAFSWAMWGKTKNESWENYRQFINGIDPRLNMVASITPTEPGKEPVIEHESYDEDFDLTPNGDGSPLNARYAASTMNGRDSGWDYSTQGIGGSIFDNVGYLQLGFFGQLSYRASHVVKGSFDAVTDLAKNWETTWDDYAKDTSSAYMKVKSKLGTDPDALAALESFTKVKFGDMWKAAYADVDQYDYAGLADGFKPWRDYQDTIAAKRKALVTEKDEVKKKALEDEISKMSTLNSFINDFFNGFIDLVKFNTDSFFESKATADKNPEAENFIAQWNTLFQASLQAYGELGDRARPTLFLEKDWYHQSSTETKIPFLAAFYVDEK